MRKNHRQFIGAGLMISLAYCTLLILTAHRNSPALSSVHVSSERRHKVRTYKQHLVHHENPALIEHEESPPARNIVDAVLQQMPEAESYPILFHYLKQLSPVDKNELQAVLNVAEEARLQLLSDQTTTLYAMDQTKQSMSRLIQTVDGDFAAATYRYLDNLDRRRLIRKERAFQEEEIQGWTLEAQSGGNRTEELAEANIHLQSLQSSLDSIQMDLNNYEARLAGADTRVLLGSHYPDFCERLEAYKAGLAAALDQDKILDKFDSIFAAMSSVHLEDI